ncbi:hypothetical protein AAVH_39416, partial [Aphelenchoides avenae]
HYSLGIFNSFFAPDGWYIESLPLEHYCDECDCQAVITNLTPANISVSKQQNFTLPNYLIEVITDSRYWKPLATPMITLVTNIKCDEVDQYASLRGIMSNLTMYGYELHMTGT